MADFCKQCSIDIFGEDFGDLKGLFNEKHLQPNENIKDVTIQVLCEGCGPTFVDVDGNCRSPNCLEKHGVKSEVNPT